MKRIMRWLNNNAAPLFTQEYEDVLKRFFTRPLYLKIETVNICNARCVFCAYRFMKRRETIMPKRLFEKVVNDYADIGGGALTMSPVVGDCLLDPYFLERLQYSRRFKEITHIGFHTNLLALDRWSDGQIADIFDLVNIWNCSVAPNKRIYRDIFGVDSFEILINNLERLCRIAGNTGHKPVIQLNGRSKSKFVNEDRRLRNCAEILTGSKISWHSRYCDWGGVISESSRSIIDCKPAKKGDKHLPCVIPLMQSAVFADGQVGLCGCADFDAFLIIGDASRESLGSILAGEKRKNYMVSFNNGALNNYCLKCTFYRPMDTEEIKKWKDGSNPFHSI
jgi:hypothetical protein